MSGDPARAVIVGEVATRCRLIAIMYLTNQLSPNTISGIELPLCSFSARASFIVSKPPSSWLEQTPWAQGPVCAHCGKVHIHRYVAHFDFQYNNRVKLGCGDVEQAERALRGVVGKRLTYRTAH